jgi:hypothetical protein
MFQSIVRRPILVLTFALLAAPLPGIHAQAPSQIVTGGNPVPPGDAVVAISVVLPLLTAVTSA